MVETILSSISTHDIGTATELAGVPPLAQALTQQDPLVLQLYRYMWQPARYASLAWLLTLGFRPPDGWHYGDSPARDRALDCALRSRLQPVVIPGVLSEREQRLARLAPRIVTYALGLGLVIIGRTDYFMLPDYRQAFLPWLTEAELWRLYGWLGPKNGALLAPSVVVNTARQVGTLSLYRQARHDPVLHALLILLPPPQRALWPKVPSGAHAFLERLL